LKKHELGKWDLSDLVKNPKSPAFEKQIQLVEKKAKQFEKIRSKLDEDDIKNLAQKIAKQEGKDFMMLLSHEYNINTALKLIEIWLKVIKYPYSYEVNGDEHKFFIHHDLGKKYSVYLSSLYENVLNALNAHSTFKVEQNSISFTVDTKQDSPLLVD